MKLGHLLFVSSILSAILAAQTGQPAESRPASAPAVVRPAETFPFFARATGSKVRVRGGPGDFHSEVSHLDAAVLVRVTGRKGDWYQVEVPGGLPLWVAMRRGDKEYIRAENGGLGLVIVNDLQLRGTADTNEPPVGELKAGDRVAILETHDEWAHVLMPTSHAGFVYSTYLKKVADDVAAAAEFKEKDEVARAAHVQKGAVSSAAAAEREKEEASRALATTALEKFAAERKKDVLERDVPGTRAALDAVVKASPDAEDRDRVRAEAALEVVKNWEADADVTRKARAAIDDAKREARAAQQTYQKDLEEIRKRKEQEAAMAGKTKSPYLTSGWVRLAPPIPGYLNSTPKHAVQKGNQREYYLVSDRYDLSDFTNKMVGILEWDEPQTVEGSTLRVVRVNKLEIIPAGGP